MSKQEQFNDRIDDLFADLNQNPTPANGDLERVPGWTWECDPNGFYTACSAEVGAILGVEAATFLGQSIFSYRLKLAAAEEIQSLKDSLDTPWEGLLQFQDANEEWIWVQVTAFRVETEKGLAGWQGFSQIAPQETPQSHHTNESASPARNADIFQLQSFGYALENGEIKPIGAFQSQDAVPAAQASLAIPVKIAEQPLGFLEFVDPDTRRKWNQDEQNLVEQVADQLSQALYSAQLFQETQASLARTEALYSVGKSAIGFEDLEDLLQTAANAITDSLPADRTMIIIFDQKFQEVTHFIDSYADPIPIEAHTYTDLMKGLSGWVIEKRQATLSPKNKIDNRESDEARRIRKRDNSGSLAIVPLTYRQQLFGTITAINGYEKPDFTQADLDLLIAMGTQIATALENSQLFQQTQTALSQTEALARQLAELNDLSEDLNRADSVEKAYERITQRAKNIFAADEVSIAMRTPEGEFYEIVAYLGAQDTNPIGDVNLIEGSNLEPLFRKGEIILNQSASDEPSSNSTIIAPISVGPAVIGALRIGKDSFNAFTPANENLLAQMASLIDAYFENQNLLDRVQKALSETRSLLQITNTATSSLEIESTLKDVLLLVLSTIQSSYGLISLINPQTQELDLIAQYLPEQLLANIQKNGLKGSLCEKVYTEKQSILIADLSKADGLNVDRITQLGLNSYQGVPLESKGQMLGTLCTFSEEYLPDDQGSLSLMEAVGRQIGVAIENANLFERTQEQAAELEVLNELGRELSTELNVDEIIHTIHKYTSILMDTAYFFVALYNEREDMVSFPLVYEKGQMSSIPAMKKRRGLTQHVIDSKESFLIKEDVNTVIESLGLERITIGDPAQSWLGVPLTIGDEVLGVIATQNADTPRMFDERDQEILESIARQSAIAIQTAGLFAETQTQSKNLQILNEMSRVLTNLRDRDTVLQTVYEYTARLMDTTYFFIAVYDANTETLEIPINILNGQAAEPIQRLIGNGLSDYILRHGTSLLLEDDIPGHMQKLGIEYVPLGEGKTPQSWMGAPMMVGSQVIGVIALQSIATPLLYDKNQLSLLESIASQTAISLQNVEYAQETQKRNQELALINRIVSEVASSLDLSRSLDIVATELGKALGLQTGIALFNDEQTKLSLIAAYSPNTMRPPVIGLEIPIEGNLTTQKVIETRQTVIINDVQNAPEAESIHDIMRTHGVISLAILPLISSGKMVGTIGLDILDEGRAFTEDEIRLAQTIILQAASAITNAQLFEQTQRQLADLEIIQETTSSLSETLEFEKICDTLIDRVATAARADTVRLMMLKGENMIITSVYPKNAETAGQIGNIIELENYPLTQKAINERKPLSIATDDPALQPHARAAFKNSGIGSHATIPMAGPEGVLGVLSLNRKVPAELFSNAAINLVSNLATQAAIAIQNSQSFDQLQSSLSDMASLYQAGAELNAIQSYTDILNVLRRHTFLRDNLKSITINVFDRPWLEDDKPDWLIPVARWGLQEYEQQPNQQYPLSPWTTATKLLQREGPTIIMDLEADSRMDETARAIYQERLQAAGLVFAPIVVATNWIGHVVAIFEQPVYPDENEIRRLQTLVSQSAIALQNLRSLEDTIRKAAQLETAAEIARDTSSTLSLDDLLNRSVNAVRERFGYYHASIFLLDESKQFAVVQASTGEAGAQMIAQKHKLQVGSNSIIGRVTGNGESLVVNDVRQNANHRPHPLLPDTKAELGIPLKIGARVIGALDVQDDDENTFREDDIIVLRTLADQISVAIDNAQSYARVEQAVEETRQRVQELTLIAKASETLASAPLETREIAATIAQQLLEILPNHNSASITLQQGDEMIPLAIVERKNGQLQQHENPEKRNFNLNDYPATRSVLENLTHQVFNISAENIPAEEKAHMQRYNIGSLAIMPLSVKGQSIGIIDLESSQPYHFSAEEFNLITTIANQAGISIDNARLYEEQTETAEQLRELDRLKSQFLANMSHELRTPLNSIIGFSRVIMKGIDGPVTDLQHQDLSAIYNAGQHLLKMINDILDISKIDAGKMELAFEDVILDDVVNSVMSTARGLVKDKPVQLVTAIEENLPMITADSTRIRQILLNFLSNAAKFTDEGSITVTVRKQLNENNAPEIYIAVTDTGIGIAPADQKDLFEPFTQVDGSATRASGGTGLGLSITRLLVELHGGRIGIDSDIGKGSTFYFTLPIQDEAPPQNTQGQTTVLAMDDDQQVLQLYERYLGGSEFTLVKLTEPQRTVELAIEIQPFAIMLDIMLPNHDGWQILEELQNTPQTRNIPVIICSIADEVEKGFDLGATDYLKKPILAEDLLNSLSRIQEYS